MSDIQEALTKAQGMIDHGLLVTPEYVQPLIDLIEAGREYEFQFDGAQPWLEKGRYLVVRL